LQVGVTMVMEATVGVMDWADGAEFLRSSLTPCSKARKRPHGILAASCCTCITNEASAAQKRREDFSPRLIVTSDSGNLWHDTCL
jgi:hypothetical protein